MDHSSYQYHHHHLRQQQEEEGQCQIQSCVQSNQSSSSTTTQAFHYQQQQYQYYSHHYRPEHYLLPQPSSCHPLGAPVPPVPPHFGSLYYPSVDHMRQVNPGLDVKQPQTRHSTSKGGNSRVGRSFLGHDGGHSVHLIPALEGSSSPFCGRRHKQVDGMHFTQNSYLSPADNGASLMPPSAYVPGNEASQVPSALSHLPPRIFWCELCRVDCNTEEILEQHKNGKKHKKNLRLLEQLQNDNQIITRKSNLQMPSSDSKPRAIQSGLVLSSTEAENLHNTETSQAISGSKISTNQPRVSGLNCEDSTLELEKKKKDHSGKISHGVKRKKSGGRVGKHAWKNAAPRRLVDPITPKEVIPLVCKLCNVRCESQVVFDSHLSGKKHLSKVKQYRGQPALYGEVGLQALYPPDPSSPSTSLVSQIQQGISDPQAVLAQLLSYILSQAPGLVATQVADLAITSVVETPPSMAMSTPVPCSTLDPKNETNMTRGSQTGTAEVTMGAENQPSSSKTEVEVAVTGCADANGNLAETSASEVWKV